MKIYVVRASRRREDSLRFYVTAENRKKAAFKAASYIESKDSDFYREISVEKKNKFIYNVVIDNEEWRLRIDRVMSELILKEEESV